MVDFISIVLFFIFLKDVEFESVEAKKQVRGSTSTKRSRAAEVHNLSERVCVFLLYNFDRFCFLFSWLSAFKLVKYCIHVQRRRDRINEKMRALQELIPRCNKVITPNSFCLCFFLPDY